MGELDRIGARKDTGIPKTGPETVDFALSVLESTRRTHLCRDVGTNDTASNGQTKRDPIWILLDIATSQLSGAHFAHWLNTIHGLQLCWFRSDSMQHSAMEPDGVQQFWD